MANSKISALTSATTPLAGTETLPIVQSGATKQVSVANLTAGRSVSALDYVMSAGNLVPSTADKGVNFTANTPAAGMTSQLLNWYEEGTFAATLNSFTIVNGTGAISAAGYYTKIGRLVFWGVNISGTGTATIASTGNSSNITGIPFTQSNRSPFLCQNGAISMTSSPGNLESNTAYTPTWAALTPSSSGVINITGCFNA